MMGDEFTVTDLSSIDIIADFDELDMLDEPLYVPDEIEGWIDETKGIERILSVISSTFNPRTAGWIASEAVVSEKTARYHAELLADIGVVASDTSCGVTRYMIDPMFAHYREVSRLIRARSKDDLMSDVASIQETIEEIQQSYDVESPDELRASSTDRDCDVKTVRECKKRASEWEYLQDCLEVYRESIRHYDAFE